MRYLTHVTGPNERWDHLAYHYYGDATRFGPIIRANRDLFGEDVIPTQLPVALTLQIPILDPEPLADGLLPPWKRAVA
jgi:Phage Tail Protein X